MFLLLTRDNYWLDNINGILKNSKSWMCGVDEKLYFPDGKHTRTVESKELWGFEDLLSESKILAEFGSDQYVCFFVLPDCCFGGKENQYLQKITRFVLVQI